MKPVSAPSAAPHEPASRGLSEAWRERSAHLYAELERPAAAMVRRAFRGAFSDHEVEDIYASAWVGTLRALERRHEALDDEEIRKYLLTAVANQASKEIRRRKRKPTAPLELVGGVADNGQAPDEQVAGAEASRVTRDLLSSLPPRRRAVMLLRYGWGLEPGQVCELVEGLSPRAYRKEITRGVDELAERMRRFERGEWCSDREPLLKAYAAGIADPDQSRQAKAHLAHCHQCSDFVSRLGGHLHDLGSGLALPVALDGLDGHVSVGERLGDVGDRVRESVGGLLSRGGETAPDLAAAPFAAGGARGAGAAGAGVLAKLAGLGTAGKIAVACVTGGAAATACLSAGLVPGVGLPGVGDGAEHAGPEPAAVVGEGAERHPVALPVERPEPSEGLTADQPADAPSDSEPPAPVEPVAPTAPPATREFGVAAAAAPVPSSDSSGGGSSGGGGGTVVQREFGP